MQVTGIPSSETPAELAARQAREAWGFVLGDVRGRRVIRDVLRRCLVLPGEAQARMGTAEALNFDAGKRSIGELIVTDLLAVNPEIWALMENERAQDAALLAHLQAGLEADATET